MKVQAPIAHYGILDATSTDIRPFVRDRVQHLEEVKGELGDSFQSQVDLYDVKRNPVLAAFSRLKPGSLNKGPKLVKYGILGAIGLSSAVVVASAGVAGLVGIAALGIGNTIAQEVRAPSGLLSTVKQAGWGSWSGLKSFEIRPDQSRVIESKVTEEDSQQSRFSSSRVQEQVLANQRKYPKSFQVVSVSGHGLGNAHLASQPFEEFSKGMKGAKEQGGRPVDLLILESCFQGNLDSLASLEDSTKFVVAAESAIALSSNKGSLPLQEMLKTLSQTGSVNEMMDSVGQASKHQRPDHLAAYDLSKLQSKLLPSLDELGQKLTKAISTESGQKVIHDAVSSSKTLEQLAPGVELKDLGNFLAILSATSSADVKDSAMKALLSLVEAVPISTEKGESVSLVARNVDPDHYSGLSFFPVEAAFEGPDGKKHDLSYKNLPQGWRDFTKAYTKLTSEIEAASADN